MRRLLPYIVVVLIGAAGCTPSGGGGGTEETPTLNLPAVAVTSPADGTLDVSTAAELSYTATGADTTTVSLVGDDGVAVSGRMRKDGSAWVPDQQLAYGKSYTATVTGTNADGTSEAKSTFTTMLEPTDTVRVQSNVGDHQTYGVGMPVILSFARPVPEDLRDDVQRRLFVTSDPPQEGSWHWIERVEGVVDEGAEVHFRPKEYWQPGTEIFVRAATGGVSWGDGVTFGRNDLTIDFKIGDDLRIEVTNSDKQLRVISNGQVIRQAPVSLGKPVPGSYSSSGTMVIFEKHEEELFDSSTYGLPVNAPDGYRTKVKWVMKLTEGGEYIHDAPWSVNDQGRRNVSHGCVNVATDHAIWLFQNALVGTPVTVTGTERHVTWRNGVTDWDRPWEEYIKRSALDHTPELA